MAKKAVMTVAEYAYNTILEMILSGELSPGEKVDLEALTEVIGSSRIPIKQALDKLCAEGLVLETPRKGMRIMPVSKEDLNSIFEMRCALEPVAYLKAFQHVTAEDIQQLRKLLDSQNKSTVEVNTVMKQNKDFHILLNSLSKDEGLIKNIQGLWTLSNRYRRLYFNETVYNKRVEDEHYALVDCLELGKKQEGVELLIEHTYRSQEIIMKLLGGKLEPFPYKIVVL